MDAVSFVTHNKLFRKSLIDQNNLYFSATQSINDNLFSVASLLCARKIAFINENLYTYRVHDNPSSITSNRDQSRMDLITVYDEISV